MEEETDAFKYIDFDLDLTDLNKVTVWVCNLLDEFETQSMLDVGLDCKIPHYNNNNSSSSEAACVCHNHHQTSSFMPSSSLSSLLLSYVDPSGKNENELENNGNNNSSKCTFCRFFRILKSENSRVRIGSKTDKNYVDKDFVNVNFKQLNVRLPRSSRSLDQPNQALAKFFARYDHLVDWKVYQSWRVPFSFIGYAVCLNQADLYHAVKNFEQIKKKFSKTFINSKLFIDYHLKHENDEEFRKILKPTNKEATNMMTEEEELLPRRKYSRDDINISSTSAQNRTGLSQQLPYLQKQSSMVSIPSIRKSMQANSIAESGGQSDYGSSNRLSLNISMDNASIDEMTTSSSNNDISQPQLNHPLADLESSSAASLNNELVNDDLQANNNISLLEKLPKSKSDENVPPSQSGNARPKLVRLKTLRPDEDELIDEAAFKKKLKFMENEIVYLDFLFSDDELNANLKAIIMSEKAKIEKWIRDSMAEIYKKLYYMASDLNASDEKQINSYSELLKTPVEREKPKQLQPGNKFGNVMKSSDSFISNDSILTIKMVNKKTTAGRIYKYKADLLMCINQKDNALAYYAKAYSLAKKEQDLFWSCSALLGLCLSSYFYFFSQLNSSDSGSSSSSISTKTAGGEVTTSKQNLLTRSESAWSDFKTNLSLKKRFSLAISNDVDKSLVAPNDLAQHFNQIISTYNQNDSTKYMSFEYALMLAKFLLTNDSRADAIEFANNLIYTKSLKLNDEFKIRRYLEISEIYKRSNMPRLAATYKWFGSSRIFTIIERVKLKLASSQLKLTNEEIGKSPVLKCLITKCYEELNATLNELVSIESEYSSSSSPAPSTVATQGFPLAKIYILNRIILLLNFVENYRQATKYLRYLIHEMLIYLDAHEIRRLCNWLAMFTETYQLVEKCKTDSSFSSLPLNSPSLDHHQSINDNDYASHSSITKSSEKMPNSARKYDRFDIKFYKIPFLNSLNIFGVNLQEFFRSDKLVPDLMQKSPSSIYIHRYKNPLLAAKKKITYEIEVSELTRLDLEFTNPLALDLHIDYIKLIVQDANKLDMSMLIDLVEFDSNPTRRSGENKFVLPELSFNYCLTAGFTMNQLGTYRIIGYVISCLNCITKIEFNELSELTKQGIYVKKDISKNHLHRLKSKVVGSYDLNVRPKMNLIERMLFVNERNSQPQAGTFLDAAVKQPIVECLLGVKESFDLNVIFADQTDYEIIEVNFNTLSYELSMAKRFDIKVKLLLLNNKSDLTVDLNNNNNNQPLLQSPEKSQTDDHQNKNKNSYALSVDSSNFTHDDDFVSATIAAATDTASVSAYSQSDTTSNIDTGLLCSLEIKFTNSGCKLENMCQIFRRQFKIKFRQLFFIEPVSIKDRNENEFKLSLKLRNLFDQNLSLTVDDKEKMRFSTDGESIEIEANSMSILTLIVSKLDAYQVLSNEANYLDANNKQLKLADVLNSERLNLLKIKLLKKGENLEIPLRMGKSDQFIKKHRSKIFKCPLRFDGFLSKRVQSDEDLMALESIFLTLSTAANATAAARSSTKSIEYSLRIKNCLNRFLLSNSNRWTFIDDDEVHDDYKGRRRLFSKDISFLTTTTTAAAAAATAKSAESFEFELKLNKLLPKTKTTTTTTSGDELKPKQSINLKWDIKFRP